MSSIDTLIAQINASTKSGQEVRKNELCLICRVFRAVRCAVRLNSLKTIYLVLAEEVPFPGPFFIGPIVE
jgi:hypothetical protein